MTVSKQKVSLTLSADLLAALDRDARRAGTTRSGLAEAWLREGATRAAERSLDELTSAYYASLRGPAQAEDEAIARAASRAAKRVVYDAPLRRAAKRTAKRVQ